ncbi:OprO/OprP family phosphate-selective porin [Aureimonas leprariae]|nr:porin [Aureimonas leprariae]
MSASAALAEDTGSGPDPLRFGSGDRYVMFAPFVQFEIGHADADPDDFLDGIDDTRVQYRRARLYTDFKFDRFGGEFTFDLATDPDPTVVYGYLNYAVTDELTLQVGQQKALFSLQDLTSARPALFNEDSQSSALQPGGYLGVATVGATALYGARNWSVSAGVFGTDVNVEPFGQGTSVMGRATYGPVLTDDAAVHLGLSLVGTFDPEPALSFAGDPGLDLFSDVSTISTGDFTAVESYEAANLELAASVGRFTLESEYTLATLDDREKGSPFLHGAYVGLLAFLTDDHRTYDGSTGTFDKVEPKAPAGPDGFGALEVGGRLDYLDLSDAGPDAGTEIAGTGILNWYLTEKLRVSLSHTYTAVMDGPDDGADFNASLLRFWFTY